MSYDRVRPSGHWLDYPNTTYGVVAGDGLEQWDQAIYELKRVGALPKNSMVLLGDSITHFNQNISGITTARSVRGYWTWANMFLGHRFDLLYNAGISGNHVEDMLARIQTDVLAHEPGWCVVEGGVNNVSGDTASFIEDTLDDIYQTLTSRGIRVVATTITPSDGTSAAGLDNINTVNKWIRQYCRSNANVILCDWAAAVARASDGHWGSATNNRTLTTDGLHPAAQGAARMGRVLANALAAHCPPADLHIRLNTDDSGLTANPGMTGTGGTRGTGVSGIAADNWTVNAASGSVTAACSKVTRTDMIGVQAATTTTGLGIWQQIACTVNSGSIRGFIDNNNVGTDWSIGDEVYGQIEFQTDSDFTPSTAFYLSLTALNVSFTSLAVGQDMFWESDNTYPLEVVRSGTTDIWTFRTPSFVIPSGSTKLRLQIGFDGTGTLRFASGTIVKGNVVA